MSLSAPFGRKLHRIPSFSRSLFCSAQLLSKPTSKGPSAVPNSFNLNSVLQGGKMSSSQAAKPAAAAAPSTTKEEPKSFVRRDRLREIEKTVQVSPSEDESRWLVVSPGQNAP